jgi:hypothetical protein
MVLFSKKKKKIFFLGSNHTPITKKTKKKDLKTTCKKKFMKLNSYIRISECLYGHKSPSRKIPTSPPYWAIGCTMWAVSALMTGLGLTT